MSRPDFIIIGAMKCATSTLHEQLALQPGFHLSEPKEPNFFSDDEEYARGFDWYAGLFDGAPTGSLRGESSTHYTKLPTYPQTLERLQAYAPDNLKLIYVMRHPVDRLVSQYIHEWSQGLTVAPLSEAIEELPFMTEYSRYSHQLRPFLEAYGRENVLPVFFERMLGQSQSELERVCKFLGYVGEPQWQEDLEAQNVSNTRWRKTPLTRLLVDSPVMETLRRNLIPKAFRERIRQSMTMQTRPELPDATRAELEAIFDADLAVLGNWLGIENLTCATYKDVVKVRPYDWTETTG